MSRQHLLRPTNENLYKVALQPVFKWLVAAALDGDTLPYGQIQHRIEAELGFSRIGRATRIGGVVGELMWRIGKADPDAPLINVLVVGQSDRLPSSGAGGFMADYFGEEVLGKKGAKERYPDLWKKYSIKAADEVHEKDAAYWCEVHKKVFGQPLSVDEIKRERGQRKQGAEEDGLPAGGRRYGKGGESEEHRALRLWTKRNPGKIDSRFAGAIAETEFDLLSGDRVDVMLRHRAKWIALEVKSRRSNEADYIRGVYQCVKYRAVLEAMDMRQLAQSKLGERHSSLKDRKLVEACLVTEADPGQSIRTLLGQHGIKLYIVSQKRKA
ncbi:hypothetical protein [Hoeflea sp.]|uniref:hypothetical protein n=1 Tax=Hoeflea sp. TaxID=1940281 RepID=UPI00198E083B|nr:hypothetical protein [Hoeflea sp.]MBC7283907.1 hypothetical protein [Hoeflea sp.]